MNVAPVAAVPPLVIVEEKVAATPAVAVIGVIAPALRSGEVAAVAVTGVHAPQLSTSLVSVIVPVPAAEFLSAHTRTYQVAAEGNVYEMPAVLEPDVARAALV